MRELADFLERIDAYFEGKSVTERWALILMPAALIGYLAWVTIEPPAEAAHNKSISDKKHVQKKLQEDKKYLNGITKNNDRDYYVKDFDKKIILSKKRADSYRKKITLIDKNLYKLSDMLYNKKSWSLFLDSITTRAHENDVTIDTISNSAADSNGSFGHVLEVGLKCKGGFSNIVNFMNDLEQNTLVTDIFKSSVYTEENSTLVNADFNISVWGIKNL
jgi:hypothetical protein